MIGVRRDDHQDAEQQAVGEGFVHGRSFSNPSLAVRAPAGRPELLEGRRACSANSPPRPPAPLPPPGGGGGGGGGGGRGGRPRQICPTARPAVGGASLLLLD